MRIIIKTKNLTLTDALDQFIQEKLGSLDKFVKFLKEEKVEVGKPLGELFVEIEKETKHHHKGPFFQAEAMINLPGKTLIAKAESEDLRNAIIEVREEMEQELKKYKFKKIDGSRKEQRKAKEELRAE